MCNQSAQTDWPTFQDQAKNSGANIQTGVIVLCSQFLDYQEFYISESEFSYYKKQWWERVEEYYNLKVFQDAQDSCIKGSSLD
jgi:hypothetical protein